VPPHVSFQHITIYLPIAPSMHFAVAKERLITVHEQGANLYGVAAYLIATTLVLLPVQLTVGMVYVTVRTWSDFVWLEWMLTDFVTYFTNTTVRVLANEFECHLCAVHDFRYRVLSDLCCLDVLRLIRRVCTTRYSYFCSSNGQT
jgi:hypothetical protein